MSNTYHCGLVKVAPDDPTRCQAIDNNRQCYFQREPTSIYCPRHVTGNITKTQLRNYNLARLNDQLKGKLDSPQLKSLTEEIALMRLMLEKLINRCQDDSDLLMESNRIQEMVTKVQQLVTAFHKIEISSQNVLNKSAILQLATIFIGIITKHVQDENIIEAISNEIPNAVANLEVYNATSPDVFIDGKD